MLKYFFFLLILGGFFSAASAQNHSQTSSISNPNTDRRLHTNLPLEEQIKRLEKQKAYFATQSTETASKQLQKVEAELSLKRKEWQQQVKELENVKK